jgi:protein arginine N-methyltransferase 7
MSSPLTDRVTVVVLQGLPKKADVLVSEILGTLLLGESALAFVSDCRKRLLTPDATIIPAAGVQFVSLIESADIKSITSASNWGGINLEGFDALQDTCNVVFTKQYGFRLSSVPYKTIASRIPVAEVDFYTDDRDSLPETRRITVTAEADGTVHAAMLYWEVRLNCGCIFPSVAVVDALHESGEREPYRRTGTHTARLPLHARSL